MNSIYQLKKTTTSCAKAKQSKRIEVILGLCFCFIFTLKVLKLTFYLKIVVPTEVKCFVFYL